MTRYAPKTVRERGRVYLAERLAERGWDCHIARRSPNEDEIIATPDRQAEVRLKFHAQERSQAVRFYDRASLDWPWDYLVIATQALAETPVTYVLSRADLQAEGLLEAEIDGAWWLQPEAFANGGFREAWHKLAAAS